MNRAAGIVLCGGQSSRMGRPKAWLELGGQTWLARAVRTVAANDGPVVVCAGPGQPLPPLPPGTIRLDDAQPGKGPLPALMTALRHVERLGWPEAVVLGVDFPLLTPAMAQFLRASLRPGDAAVVPNAGGRAQPLTAAYRSGVALAAERLVRTGVLSMHALLGEIAWRALDPADYAALDPHGDMLRNINMPEEYADLLAGWERRGE